MANTIKKQTPIDAKQHLIRLYFCYEKMDFQAILEGFKLRGYETDSFYWMYPEMNPSAEDLEKILADEQYALKPEEIKYYIEQYKKREKE